jgi:urease accessory protein
MADLLARPAIGGGARTSALVLYVAPNAESCTDLARRALADTSCAHGVSTWNGILAARLLAAQPGQAITAITNLARALSERPVPRAWSV